MSRRSTASVLLLLLIVNASLILLWFSDAKERFFPAALPLSESRLEATSPLPRGPLLYICGWIVDEDVPYTRLLFPNHTYIPLTNETGPPDIATASPNDVMIASERHDPGCQVVWNTKEQFFDWVVKFPGKVLSRNGESRHLWQGPESDNLFFMGTYPDSVEHRTIRYTALQMTLQKYGPDWWPKLLDPKQKSMSKRENFLIYAVGNCVGDRQVALSRLAEIDVVDCVGRCCRYINGTFWKAPPPGSPVYDKTWVNNRESFSGYRFCLVMENKAAAGYITEKILNGFLAGCVPIWYGTQEIFDMFNKEAFIFYNPNDPEPALARVRQLEASKEAYDAIMKQPILAHGEKTIKKYFSYTPELGGGELLKKVHRMMNISDI